MKHVADAAQVPPNWVSFVGAMRVITFAWRIASARLSAGTSGKRLERMRDELRHLILPPRRPELRYPRVSGEDQDEQLPAQASKAGSEAGARLTDSIGTIRSDRCSALDWRFRRSEPEAFLSSRYSDREFLTANQTMPVATSKQ